MNRDTLDLLFQNLQTHFRMDTATTFSIEYVAESDNGALIPNFLKKSNLFAYEEKWGNKIDAITSILQRGGQELDIASALTPRNESTATFYKIATIFGRTTNGKTQMEFLHEVHNGVILKSFTLSTFYLDFEQGKKELVEVGATWKDGIELHAVSIKDFIRNPDTFLKERFKK